ncbi:MAG: adenylyltransferase/cytidyltransferase family protein [Endomicrobium sp.]|jgi:bifunctional NMN adenylyltransferase/nudix hydrolase|nr:adenylyltransferase/cytidyltransferase family protein [Endomicrobium sp.]
MLDAVVFIGRFQPPNLAHIEILKKAQTLAKKVIVLAGSANRERSFLNPWTAAERIEMIKSVKELDHNKIVIAPLSDSNNDFAWWLDLVKKTVKETAQEACKIGVIGCKKDKSSYYLDYFPQWQFIEIPNLSGGISSTQIREELFKTLFETSAQDPFQNKIAGVCQEVERWLKNWFKNNRTIYENLKMPAEK